MQNKIKMAMLQNKNCILFLTALICTLPLFCYLSGLLLFTNVMILGDCYLLLMATAYIAYYSILYFCNKKTLTLKSVWLYSLLPILFILLLFDLHYMGMAFVLILALCCGWGNCGIRLKVIYFHNLLFALLYILMSVLGLVVSYYLQFSQHCGYSEEKRISLNNNLDIVNILYDCGATTSYTNIVYIFLKDKKPSKFKKLDEKYQAFSAYRCYLDEVDIKIINDKNIQIQTNCKERVNHKNLIGEIKVDIKPYSVSPSK